jgi:hypothetical protein
VPTASIAPSRFFAACALLAALGCGKADTLTVKPASPGAPELIPSPALEEFSYKKVLLLPFEGEVSVKDLDAPALKEQAGRYYTAKVEKELLNQGFEVISSEIVARAQKGTKGAAGMSTAELAMVMGRETKADAVFSIQKLSLEGVADFYSVDEMNTTRVDPSKVKQNLKHGDWYEVETKDCVVRLKYYVFKMEGKLIDAHTGNVLWVGNGAQTAIDSLPESYVAKLDKDCGVEEQNFVFTERLMSEGQLDATVTGLAGRLLGPLKKVAVKGKPLPADKPKVAKKPEKKAPEPPAPQVRTAVVSTKNAALRAGPGSRNERMRRLSRKTKVEVLETMGEWHKVKLQDSTVGWMHEATILLND